MAAAGGGWWRGPPEQTQCGTRAARSSQIYDSPPLFSHTEAPLWSFWMYWTLSVTFCHLCLPSPFPVPHSHSSFFFVTYLSSPFLYFSIWYLFLSLSPSFAPRHPGQLFIQTGCLQLSVQSWVAAQEVGRVACGAELFPNASLSSWGSIRDLNTTLTPQQPQNHPHTPVVQRRQQQKMYWTDRLKNILHTQAIK